MQQVLAFDYKICCSDWISGVEWISEAIAGAWSRNHSEWDLAYYVPVWSRELCKESVFNIKKWLCYVYSPVRWQLRSLFRFLLPDPTINSYESENITYYYNTICSFQQVQIERQFMRVPFTRCF